LVDDIKNKGISFHKAAFIRCKINLLLSCSKAF
jgi:hypothetical protein